MIMIEKTQLKHAPLSSEIITNIIEQIDYLPLSGGTLTGDLNIDNALLSIDDLSGFYVGEKTLEEILNELKTDKNNYTAFEVFPTTEEIPAGTIDNTTGIEYYTEVSPWNLFGLELKTKYLQKDSNIIIDWGDGKITDVKNTISDSASPTSTIDKDSMYYPSEYDSKENEIKIEFTHKYETQGRYIVKIYGNTYWGIRAKYDKGFSNLISRIFERDLSIASCVVNVSSLCRSA